MKINTQPTFHIGKLLLTAVALFLVACGGNADNDSNTSATQFDSATEIVDSSESASTPIPTPDPQIALFNETLLLAKQANDLYIRGEMTAWEETVTEIESMTGDFDFTNYEQLGYESEEAFTADLGSIMLVNAYREYTGANNDNLERAFDTFNEAIEMEITQLSAAYSGRGHVYRLQDNLKKALADFDSAIALNAENADAYRGKAMIYYYQNDIATANDFLKQALEINPEFGRIYALQDDIAYYDLGDAASAEVLYEQGIEYEPGYADGYYSRARLYDSTGRDGECIDDINSAISLKPNYGWYYYQRGFCRLGLEQYAIALDDFDTAISLESGASMLADVYEGKGHAYYDLNKYNEAIDAYSTAITYNPDNANYYRSRGNAYKFAENYSEAINDYTEALSLDSSNTWAYYGLGTTYDRLNNYQDSYTNYETFLEMELGDMPETRYACERMNALYIYNAQNLFDMFLGTGCERFPSGSNGTTMSGGTDFVDSCSLGVISGICVQTLSECPYGENGSTGTCMSESEAAGLQSREP